MRFRIIKFKRGNLLLKKMKRFIRKNVSQAYHFSQDYLQIYKKRQIKDQPIYINLGGGSLLEKIGG